MIKQVPLPSASVLTTADFDYMDCFESPLAASSQQASMPAIGRAFFRSAPNWIGWLFQLRNRLVTVFGLKTGNREEDWQVLLDNFTCEPGQNMGLFKVYERHAQEVILGEDDKHLNFRVSLFQTQPAALQPQKLSIATTVKFNHWSGRLYFFLIKPFHKAIVKRMLRSTVAQLNDL